MAFRRGGAGKRRDANEPDIIKGLKAYGVRVWQIHGRARPDLLCYYNRRWTPLEVKSARGRLTVAQQQIPWPVVRDLSQALREVGVVLR